MKKLYSPKIVSKNKVTLSETDAIASKTVRALEAFSDNLDVIGLDRLLYNPLHETDVRALDAALSTYGERIIYALIIMTLSGGSVDENEHAIRVDTNKLIGFVIEGSKILQDKEFTDSITKVVSDATSSKSYGPGTDRFGNAVIAFAQLAEYSSDTSERDDNSNVHEGTSQWFSAAAYVAWIAGYMKRAEKLAEKDICYDNDLDNTFGNDLNNECNNESENNVSKTNNGPADNNETTNVNFLGELFDNNVHKDNLLSIVKGYLQHGQRPASYRDK